MMARKVRSLIAVAIMAGVALVVERWPERQPYDHLYARAVQRQRLRWLAYHIYAYAREHKRPAFTLDSVLAHLDSSTAVEFKHLMIDIWGMRVFYDWDESSFTLAATGGARFGSAWAAAIQPPPNSTKAEQYIALFAAGRRLTVREEYGWPAGARGTRNALGQFVNLSR